VTTGTLRVEKSELLDIFTYPAGETQVRLTEAGVKFVQRCGRLNVIANIYNAQHHINTLLTLNALDGILAPGQGHLFLPYLPYSRADRRFCPGDCLGLVMFFDALRSDVIFDAYTLDAHSAIAEKYGVVNISPLPLIKRSIVDFARRNNTKSVTVLYPDRGASERYTLTGHINCNTDGVTVNVLHCSKRRNPVTGKLEGFDVPGKESFADSAVLIVDDICDGGGTFVGIADSLAGYGLTLGLYVTHGIFSKGFGELNERFDHIYTTNSFPEKGPKDLVTTYDAVGLMLEATR
jgi:ribose-phosphate pyrophosphokinase